MNNTPIVISGSIAIDRIMSFNGTYRDHIRSDKLDTLSISIFLDTQQDAYGGVGANIAYSLALLGKEPFLVGSTGPDAVTYMENLAHVGVNITHVFESKLPTAAFNVITDADQNQVGGFYPGAMFDSDSLTFKPWKNASPIVVISPHDPKAMRRQVQECRQWGLRLCYDIGQQVSNLSGEDMAQGVQVAEMLILNEYELGVLSQKTGLAPEKIKQTIPIVITTLGKNGSVIEGSKIDKPIKVGIAEPNKLADPTGAGDAFRAGFLYGFVHNWPLAVSAQLGAVTASFAIEAVGTQNHSFTIDTVKTRYTKAFGSELPAED